MWLFCDLKEVVRKKSVICPSFNTNRFCNTTALLQIGFNITDLIVIRLRLVLLWHLVINVFAGGPLEKQLLLKDTPTKINQIHQSIKVSVTHSSGNSKQTNKAAKSPETNRASCRQVHAKVGFKLI